MREFVFVLESDPGCNPVSDTLAEHPSARVRSLSCHATPESLWRVDRVTGTPAAVEAVVTAYQEPDYCTDCLVSECDSRCDVQVLDRTEESAVLYARWDDTGVCESVPHLALEYLGAGLLFETDREGRRYEWRIVAPDGTDLSGFHAALVEATADCTGIELERIGDVDSWDGSPPTDAGLPPEQREALVYAVEHGYYETPRETDLQALSEALGVPRSTLSYRLRRAEAKMAKAVAAVEPTEPVTPQ
jgi:predicted DNA binding protein